MVYSDNFSTSEFNNDRFNNSRDSYKLQILIGAINFSSTDKVNSNNGVASSPPILKPILKRYIVLFLFALNSANKAFQCIQIPASTKKLTYYYNTENWVINTTSVVFMLSFVFLSIPACFLIEHLGMRNSVLLASLGLSAGAVVKCFSCHEDGILLLFVGQIIVSLCEQMVFQVPPRLASVWFPDHQVSSAVATCYLGNQLGAALGFLIPELVFKSANTKVEIGLGLYYIFFYTAIVSVVFLVVDYFLFGEAPKRAPGDARLKQIEEEKMVKELNAIHSDEMSFMWKNIKQLLSEKSFNLLCLSYGINVGLGYAIATVLYQVLGLVWPGDGNMVGKTGFIIIVFGAFGLPLWGYLLDASHRYKAINVYLTQATMLTLVMFGYVVSFMHSVKAVYVAAGLFGVFQTGLLVAGLEYAVELTYPSPELLTSSLMNIMPQIFGLVFVYSTSYIVDHYGAIWTHAYYVGLITMAIIMLLCTRESLRRQKVIEQRKLDAKVWAAGQMK